MVRMLVVVRVRLTPLLTYPISAVVALTLLVSMSTAVNAAMCLDIATEPARPVVQATTKVVMKEQWAALSGDSFDLVARRDGHADVMLGVSRVSAGSLTWVGQVVFPEPGAWTLRAAIAAPDNHYPCFEKAVIVVASGAAPADVAEPLPTAFFGLAAFLLALLVGVRFLRPRWV